MKYTRLFSIHWLLNLNATLSSVIFLFSFLSVFAQVDAVGQLQIVYFRKGIVSLI